MVSSGQKVANLLLFLSDCVHTVLVVVVVVAGVARSTL